MAWVPTTTEQAQYNWLGRLYDKHDDVSKLSGIEFTFKDMFNYVGTLLSGKKKEKKAPEPKEPGKEGGHMEYRSDFTIPSRVAEIAYEMSQKDNPAIEADIHSITKMYERNFGKSDKFIEGYENGLDRWVAYNHPNGKKRNSLEKLITKCHEDAAYEHTIRGFDHMIRQKDGTWTDHPEIDIEANRKMKSYLTMAAKELNFS
jgi:hypothetical protein